MTVAPPHLRVLAIDPTSRGFTWAVLESTDLIDWRLTHVPEPRHSHSLMRIEKLISTFRPQVVAVEDFSRDDSRRCERVRNLIRAIEFLASVRHIKSVRISPKQVHEALGLEEATKYEVAQAIAARYPKELGGRMPRIRKPWMSEDERMSIFDAVGLALASQEGRA
jgi:Holliday junction resolvasome RuvABC endonuclease subunit